MNREKIDLTSVISVLILGEKGAPYEVSGRLKFWGKIKGRILILEREDRSD